jgi:hypothetical protein
MRPLRRYKCRSEDNIKIVLTDIRYEGVELNHLAYDRNKLQAFVTTVMNLRTPYETGSFRGLRSSGKGAM